MNTRNKTTKAIEEMHKAIVEHNINLIEGGNTLIELEQRGKDNNKKAFEHFKEKIMTF